MKKFLIASKPLFDSIKKSKVLFKNNPVVPICQSFHFSCTPDNLKITYHTLSTIYQTDINHESTDTFGFCINARLLHRFLAKLPEQPLAFIFDETLNQLTIKFYNGEITILVDEQAVFPAIPSFEPTNILTIKSPFFLSRLQNISHAASNDDLRPAMKGVQLLFQENRLSITATDGHILQSAEILGDWIIPECDLILPLNNVSHLNHLFNQSQPIIIQFTSASYIIFIQANLRLICRVINERYPSWQELIATESPNKLQINRQIFLNTLQNISPFLNKQKQFIMDISENETQIKVNNLDYNITYLEKIESSLTGDLIKIGFNQRFMLTCINNLVSEELRFDIITPNKAVIIRPSNENVHSFAFIMPMMLHEFIDF